MGLISSSWVIEKDKNIACYWPAYIKSTTKREKAILNHEALQTDKCAVCPIIVKFSSDNYDVVNAKLKALEEAQDSQAESEFENNNNRHRKSNKYDDYAYSSDENGGIPPKAPPPPKPLKLTIKAKDKNPQLVEELQDQINYSNNILQKKLDNNARLDPLLSTASSCKNSFLQYQKNNSPPRLQKNIAKPLGICSSGSSLASDGISVDENVCQGCKSNEAVMKELVKTIEKLREDIKFLIQLNQDKDSQFIGTYERESFKTVDELGKFDKDLENDDEYFQKTCIRLSLVGGRDGATATRKILATIISHNLALQLNWSGRNNKGGLKDYCSIIKCIAAAVRRNPNTRSYTNDEVQAAIKAWLRNATDRDGGRSKRLSKSVEG